MRYKSHKFSSMIFKLETSCRFFHNPQSTEEMLRAKKPCRQLNSEAIKSAAICYLAPVISGRCSVVSAKCICNVKEKALPKSWNAICRKRDSCDRAISGISNVAFFFSAICTQEKKKGSIQESEDESDSSDEEFESSQVPSSTSQQWLDGNLASVNKALCPAISYWVALTTPNGAPASPISVHKALLNCGVDVIVDQVQFQEGKECPAMKELYKVLKDHKNQHMQDLVLSSYRHCYKQEARKVIGNDSDFIDSQDLEECGKENVVRVTIINKKFESSLGSAIERLIEAKLQIDKFGFTASSITAQPPSPMVQNDEKRFSDKLTILVNDISIAMEKLNYATYRGKVYKKESRAKYTFSYRCEARVFVNTLATNELFKPRLIREMRRVVDLVSDPCCELFRPLAIDYDLIEVNQGVCWSLKERSFVKDAIQEDKIGKVSPRAFSPFDSTQEPDPKYFRQILENSLSPEEQSSFCEDFLKLLNYQKKKHKDKVPCLVGDANSGKTSLFFPILGLVHHGNVATVTKQRAFNKSMISKFTEVIFIDEATESTLDIDDWKTLTQGGYSAHDVKYQAAKSFINRCPMIITSQRKLDFGPSDQPAMDRRLSTYEFRSLPNPQKSAATWLRSHPMDCVLWATEKAKTCTREDDGGEDPIETDEEQSFLEDGILQEKEKEELRALCLVEGADDTSDQSAKEGETLQDTAPVTESEPDFCSQSGDIVDILENQLCTLRPESLQHRMMTHMLETEQAKQQRQVLFEQERYAQRKAWLKERGVSSQNAELLPKDSDEPTPSPIARDLERFARARTVAEQDTRRQAARKAFEGAWLKETEKELQDCVRRLHSSQNPSTRNSLEAYREVLEDKLKNHHKNLGTLGSEEALEERRRTCVSLGLLDRGHQHLVKSVFEALPTKEELGFLPTSSQQKVGGTQAGAASESEDEGSLFITPQPRAAPPASPSPREISNVDDLAMSEALMRNSTRNMRKRPMRRPHSQANEKRPRKTLLNYFSQKEK